MERALRLYNGRPILNSVDGKAESMANVLPIAAKYGAVLVALTLDETGIPTTVEGRVAIAERIIEQAEKYGIARHDIIFDALTMTAATDSTYARTTLDTVEYIKRTMKLHTVLGVSNISFGLPEREVINAAFLSHAIERGLSAAIMNPLSELMTDTFFASTALSSNPQGLQSYISRFTADSAPTEDTDTLTSAIVAGLRDESAIFARELLASNEPMTVINGHIIPALDQVGKLFEQNKLYLPGLLASAESAGRAFEQVKQHMSTTGQSAARRAKVILATVKGDIHDIGKNISVALFENYNYEIIDMGKDVSPTAIVERAIAEGVTLVGLSALMTTTVKYMEETILLLREKHPTCRIIVGGAVLTQSYADRIKADFYAKDALAGVNYANSLEF